MKDYYKTLDLNFGAKEGDIKKAYRSLAQKYHPDKHFGNKKYDELFKEINEAYSILSEPSKKLSYDIRYRDYFFKQSSSTNTNNTNTSSGSNSESTQREESSTNTKENNQQATSMNKETFTENTFYNNKVFRFIILLIGIGIGTLIYKWKDISSYYDEKESKEKYERLVSSIQETSKFNELDLSELKIPRVTLETRWKGGLMYYKFYIISKKKNESSYKSLLPDSLQNDPYFETRVKTIQKISIEFMDKDGFKVFSLPITISDMTRNIDDNGNVIAYSINANIQMKPELYKDFQKWEFTYVTN